jgi:hypothetical protein
MSIYISNPTRQYIKEAVEVENTWDRFGRHLQPHVIGDSLSISATVAINATTNGNILELQGIAGNDIWYVYQDASGDSYQCLKDSADAPRAVIHTSGDSYFVGGNLGIQTNAPTHTLSITGDLTTSSNAYFANELTVSSNSYTYGNGYVYKGLYVNQAYGNNDFAVRKSGAGSASYYQANADIWYWNGLQVFNNNYLDKNFKINKQTAGDAYVYDAGNDEHSFSGHLTSASSVYTANELTVASNVWGYGDFELRASNTSADVFNTITLRHLNSTLLYTPVDYVLGELVFGGETAGSDRDLAKIRSTVESQAGSLGSDLQFYTKNTTDAVGSLQQRGRFTMSGQLTLASNTWIQNALTLGTSATLMTVDALLATPIHGTLEFYDDRLYLTNVGTQRPIDRTSDVPLTTTTVTNTVVETTIYTGVIGANDLKVGNHIHMDTSGVLSNATAADDIAINVYCGADQKLSYKPAIGNVTDEPWHVDMACTVRTVGAGGTVAMMIDIDINGNVSHFHSIENVDTTVAENLIIKVQWDNAKAGNTISLYQGSMHWTN